MGTKEFDNLPIALPQDYLRYRNSQTTTLHFVDRLTQHT